MSNSRRGNKSLNAKGRSTELDRISRENKKILQRMLTVRSEHDVKKLKADAVHHEKLLKRLRMVKYVPRPDALSEVMRRGRDEIAGEMESIASKQGDDDMSTAFSVSMTSQSTKKSTSSTAASAAAKTSKNNKKKWASNAETGTHHHHPIPTNIMSPNTKQTFISNRRNSAKEDLTLLAKAAKVDETYANDETYTEEKKEQDVKDLLASAGGVSSYAAAPPAEAVAQGENTKPKVVSMLPQQTIRPTTAEEISVEVEKVFKKLIPVVDAPEDQLERGVEVTVNMTNSRRPAVLDIVVNPIQRNTPLTSLLPEGKLKTSVSIPTLISIDQEHTDSYVEGLIASLNIKLEGSDEANNDAGVRCKLQVKGGRPSTTAASKANAQA